MDSWKEIKLPYICERLIAFAVASDEEVFVVSYEGAHHIELGQRPNVHTDRARAEDWDSYEERTKTVRYEGKSLPALGVYGGTPRLENAAGDRIDMDLKKEALKITSGSGSSEQTIKFEDLSGDWGYATFSPSGMLVILGLPYGLRVFRKT